MKLYTIGYSQKTAQDFFETLKGAGVKKLIDIRLWNNGQLAGFARAVHLPFLLREICGISYHEMTELAPLPKLLDDYKNGRCDWAEYEERFLAQLSESGDVEKLERAFFEEPCCFLCSEPSPEQCHRTLLAEKLGDRWSDLEIIHL
jgi:uncharacterized protein (DUF488 family)